MPRGKAATIGETFVSANGYHYTRTEEGWVLTHKLIVETKLGRKLEPNERVRYKDNDRTNLDPDNLIVTVKGTVSKAAQRARLQARIDELQAQLALLGED